MLEQGYGIMPNTILFNDNLKDKEKLLYCFISSLCAKEGYCYATNKYIAEMLNVKRTGGEKRKGKLTSQTISSYISSLQKHGYINITLVYKPKTKQIKERIIKLNSLLNKEDPINKLVNTYPLNKEDPINKLTKDNNIINNITNNNINISKKYFENEFLNNSFINFINHRKEIKKPLKETGIKYNINQINKWLDKYKVEQVIGFINNSITNGYQGIFEPKQNQKFVKPEKTNINYDLIFD